MAKPRRHYTSFSGRADLFTVEPPRRNSVKERELRCEFEERLRLMRKQRKKLLRMVDPTVVGYHGSVPEKDIPFILAKIAKINHAEARFVAWLEEAK